jgi:hypothetical protein
MSVGTTAGLVMAGIGAAGSIGGALIGSNAAKTASQQQTQADQSALAEQQREFNVSQGNAQPFINAGQQSIGTLMAGLNNGTFGPGSTPAFTAPTLEQAQQTPGYQFTQQQGEKGIAQAAAAAGGAISGGTLKAASGYNQNLASTYYQQAFNNALSEYGTNLANQQQQFGQLLAPVQIGAGSTANLNATQTSAASSIAQLMASLGSSQAAGTVGSANAISSGIAGATNGIGQSLLLGKLLPSLGGAGGNGLVPTTGGQLTIGPNGTVVPYTGNGAG